MDTETDSIIGEIPDVGSRRAIELATTRDGRFAVTMGLGEGIRVFDLDGLSLVSQVLHQGLASFAVLPDPLSVLAMTNLTPAVVYELPMLAVDTVLSEVYRRCLPLPNKSEVAAITRYPLVGAGRDGVARLATDGWAVIDSFGFVSPETGGRVISYDATISSDGTVIYLLAEDAVSPAVLAFNLETHLCLFRTPVLTAWYSYADLTPGGDELWVTQGHRGGAESMELGHVLVLDPGTGVVLDTVQTRGLWREYPNAGFPLGPLVFHPTRSVAYLCSGYPLQSLLVVNTASRKVERILERGPLYDIAIIPR